MRTLFKQLYITHMPSFIFALSPRLSLKYYINIRYFTHLFVYCTQTRRCILLDKVTFYYKRKIHINLYRQYSYIMCCAVQTKWILCKDIWKFHVFFTELLNLQVQSCNSLYLCIIFVKYYRSSVIGTPSIFI